MPLYEYRCEKCGRTTEVIQSFGDKPLRSCPHCRSRRIRKLLSSPAIQFKGSGWYVTDYGGKSQSRQEGGASDAEKKDGPKPDAAAKPAKKGSRKRSGD